MEVGVEGSYYAQDVPKAIERKTSQNHHGPSALLYRSKEFSMLSSFGFVEQIPPVYICNDRSESILCWHGYQSTTCNHAIDGPISDIS